MAPQTTVSTFVVDHGRVTEEGGRLRNFPRRRLDEPDVDLHILAEPSGLKGDELGAQALDAIGRLFLQDRLSLTGALTRALISTHQTLLDWNRRSVPREQVSSGITAAIVSSEGVYFAQTGPSLVYIRRNGVLERLLPGPEAHSSLGEGDIEPALRRLNLDPGDLVLAASVSLETVLDDGALDAMLARGIDEALPELYLLTRDLPAFALFVISCRDATEDDPPQPLLDSDFADLDTEEADSVNAHDLKSATKTAPAEPDLKVADGVPAPLLISPPPLDISRSVIRLRNDQSIGRSDYARTTGTAPRLKLNISQTGLIGLAGAVAVLLFVGAFAVPDLIRENRSERAGLLLESAQAQLTAAQGEDDPGVRRQLLEETRRLAAEVQRIDPVNASAAGVHQQATDNLTVMDAVFDLGPLTTITTLGRQITGEVSLDAITIIGGNAYLLDAGEGRVISVPVTGASPPVVVFASGETYSGTPAKEPVFFTWEGTEADGRLLILDAERKLFEVRPGSLPGPLPLRRTNTWSSVAGLAAYDGNLYVLDPAGDRIHRYLPAAVGFDSEPAIAVGSPELSQGQGFAVDGDIIVFFEDGRLRRYRGGNEVGFGLDGIDREPKTVAGIDVVEAGDEVYIADTTNKRVIVAAKDGVFRRQLVSNAFTDLRALAVDPSGGQLYVVVGDALLTAPIVR
ncbi:MAG: hypothetical protein GEU75_00900 [Dehalococcoidia bacterium]|nr:hypothetical protein [Dehalococcoidia bacterium]